MTTDSPTAPGALGPLESETIAWMLSSDSVRLLDVGAIAAVLVEADVRDGDGNVLDALDLAKRIIKAQTDAGLGTFVLAELRAFIDGIKGKCRGQVPD